MGSGDRSTWLLSSSMTMGVCSVPFESKGSFLDTDDDVFVEDEEDEDDELDDVEFELDV